MSTSAGYGGVVNHAPCISASGARASVFGHAHFASVGMDVRGQPTVSMRYACVAQVPVSRGPLRVIARMASNTEQQVAAKRAY